MLDLELLVAVGSDHLSYEMMRMNDDVRMMVVVMDG
jgi:hypothetical protein